MCGDTIKDTGDEGLMIMGLYWKNQGGQWVLDDFVCFGHCLFFHRVRWEVSLFHAHT